MPVRRFLERLAQKDPVERAGIVRTLARLYLTAPLDADSRRAARAALISVLDDPAPRVRRALAEALSDAPDAPRTIILTLAQDQPDIAGIVLSRSPVLSESELVDLLGVGDACLQAAIARRQSVGVGLAAAIIEISGADACLALLSNPGAVIADFSFRRLVKRHCRDGAVRTALLDRDDLPLTLRHMLVDGLADALGDLVILRGWLAPERTVRLLDDCRDGAVVGLATSGAFADQHTLAEQLRRDKRLTPSLVIRAACLGNTGFFLAGLSVLADMPEQRVAALLADGSGAGLSAVCRRAGLPRSALPAVQSLIAQLRNAQCSSGSETRPLSAEALEQVLRDCAHADEPECDETVALISRLAAEAARNEIRAETGGYFRAA